MKKKLERRQDHNIGTHKERMIKRKAKRGLRIASVSVKTGKYTPAVEDKKHLEANSN